MEKEMKSGIGVLWGVFFLIAVVAGFYLFAPRLENSWEKDEMLPATSPVAIVIFDESGFIPNTVTVEAGQTVEWVNKSGGDFWPASNIHPTHSLYPGSSIFKCKTAEEPTLFDACRPVPSRERYSFTFTREGEWRYHDHVRASRTGTVIVK